MASGMPVTGRFVAMICMPTAIAAVTALAVAPTAALVVFTVLQVPCAILALRNNEPSTQVRARLARRDRRAWIALVGLATAAISLVLIEAAFRTL